MPLSKQRLEKIRAIPDDEIDTSDIPELDDTFWENAEMRFRGKRIKDLTEEELKAFHSERDRLLTEALHDDEGVIDFLTGALKDFERTRDRKVFVKALKSAISAQEKMLVA